MQTDRFSLADTLAAAILSLFVLGGGLVLLIESVQNAMNTTADSAFERQRLAALHEKLEQLHETRLDELSRLAADYPEIQIGAQNSEVPQTVQTTMDTLESAVKQASTKFQKSDRVANSQIIYVWSAEGSPDAILNVLIGTSTPQTLRILNTLKIQHQSDEQAKVQISFQWPKVTTHE